MATNPVSGAAKYTPVKDEFGHGVYMTDGEGFTSKIQNCATRHAAEKAAEKWQIKENKAVTGAAK